MSQCIRCRVTGRVQGVWFRGSTRDQASKLGLKGAAINLPDGSVEVIACGDDEQLATLSKWLRQGPELAEVSDVCCEHIGPMSYTEFSIE